MNALYALLFMVVGGLFALIWLLTMRERLLRHIATAAAIGALCFFGLATYAAYNAAGAQQQQQRPGTGPNCMDLGTAKADAQWAKIMQDNDGDWWILLRFTSTGRTLIGFISRQSGMFCATGEGKVNPES